MVSASSVPERPSPGERKRPRNFSRGAPKDVDVDDEEEYLVPVKDDDADDKEKLQQSPRRTVSFQDDSIQLESLRDGDNPEQSEPSSISEMMEARLKKMPSRRTLAHAVYRSSARSFANLLPFKASEDDPDRELCAYCRALRMSVDLAGSTTHLDHCTCEKRAAPQQQLEEKPDTDLWRYYDKCEMVRKTVSKYAGFIVNDQGFQILMVMLILLNSLLIGISTFDFIEDNPRAKNAFETMDLAFLIVFTVELCAQFLHHGYNLFFDGWLIFDLLIVITSWTLESISVLRTLRLRSFRIFRAFRLTTRIRALKRLVLVGSQRCLVPISY